MVKDVAVLLRSARKEPLNRFWIIALSGLWRMGGRGADMLGGLVIK